MLPCWINGSQSEMWIWYLIANTILQFVASGRNISTFIQSKSSPREFGTQLSSKNHQCQCDLPKDINSAIILLFGKKILVSRRSTLNQKVSTKILQRMTSLSILQYGWTLSSDAFGHLKLNFAPIKEGRNTQEFCKSLEE